MARRAPFAALAGALALCAALAAPAAALELPKPLAPGEVIADFEAVDIIDGKSYKLSDALGEGGRALVVFWSFYCGTCQEELPLLQQELDLFKEKGVRLLTVTLDREETFAKIKKMVSVRKYAFPMLQGINEAKGYDLEETFKVRVTPALFLLNKERKILFSNYGAMSPEDLLAAIDQHQ